MQLSFNKITAVAVALVYLSFLVYLGFTNARLGWSQRLNSQALAQKDFDKVKSAIEYYPSNSAAYRTDGFLALENEDYANAAEKLKRAIEFQPNDYLLRLRLGYAFYKIGDFENALDAYQKSIELAPHYAHPKWYMGRLLLKLDKTEDAFASLRAAALANPEYLPDLMHLASERFSGDANVIERIVSPTNVETKKRLAHFFIRHKLSSDDTKKFLLSEELSETEKNEFIAESIKNGDFNLARSIWRSAYGKSNEPDDLILNGDFESEIKSSEIGFSWQTSNQNSSLLLALDGEDAFSNKTSLQIIFDGNQTSEPFISQLCLTRPGGVYELSFAARTEKLVAGGLPTVSVKDAQTSALLGKSISVSEKTTDWEVFKIRFNAGSRTDAVIIEVKPENCSSSSCPIFGTLWLDDFRLKTVSR